MNQTHIDGGVVKVGDWVGFKSDIEQSGKVVAINRAGGYRSGVELTLENESGFSGDYIGGQTSTTLSSLDCWID